MSLRKFCFAALTLGATVIASPATAFVIDDFSDTQSVFADSLIGQDDSLVAGGMLGGGRFMVAYTSVGGPTASADVNDAGSGLLDVDVAPWADAGIDIFYGGPGPIDFTAGGTLNAITLQALSIGGLSDISISLASDDGSASVTISAGSSSTTAATLPFMFDDFLASAAANPGFENLDLTAITNMSISLSGAMQIDQVDTSLVTPGASEFMPLLPDEPVGSGWAFNDFDITTGCVDPAACWFDPPMAEGYTYATDGNSLFTSVGLPSFLPDGDGQYTVSDTTNGSAIVPVGGNFVFPTPVSEFTITGIDPTVDGGDPLAFPTALTFDQSVVSFTMTPIAATAAVPEPSTYAMALMGLLGLGVVVRRKKSRLRRAA